eukprot:Colp12_sorted_trinity150504_noHs@29735
MPITLTTQAIKEVGHSPVQNGAVKIYDDAKLPSVDTLAHTKVKTELVTYVTSSLRGYYHANEDRFCIYPNLGEIAHHSIEQLEDCAWFGMFDGHGGQGCSETASKRLHEIFVDACQKKVFADEELDFSKVLAESFIEMENDWCQRAKTQRDTSGSCALAVLVHGNNIHVANCGDCEAALISCEIGKPNVVAFKKLNKIHTCVNHSERQRVL